MPKKVCGNGFWLFAQVDKQKLGIPGPFREFVPLAETKWEVIFSLENLKFVKNTMLEYQLF